MYKIKIKLYSHVTIGMNGMPGIGLGTKITAGVSFSWLSSGLLGKCRNQVDGRGLKRILRNFDL
jgi:hypothetical protein